MANQDTELTQNHSGRKAAGASRIPGVLGAGHPVQKGMDGVMPIWGLSTESTRPGRSRWWYRLSNRAMEMVRGYGCSRRSRHAPTLLPATRCQSTGPLGALLISSPALDDVQLLTALQVLQVHDTGHARDWLGAHRR